MLKSYSPVIPLSVKLFQAVHTMDRIVSTAWRRSYDMCSFLRCIYPKFMRKVLKLGGLNHPETLFLALIINY